MIWSGRTRRSPTRPSSSRWSSGPTRSSPSRRSRGSTPVRYTPVSEILPAGESKMAYRPVSIDHVNIFVRNAESSLKWYTDVFGFHVQDTMMFPGTDRMRAAFLSCDPDHAHDIALFEVGEDAPLQEKGQVGLNHVAWRMETLEGLKEMYQKLQDKGVPVRVSDHTVSIGVYFSDPDGNGLEVYYELPRNQWNQDRPFSIQGRKGRFPGPWDEALREAAPAVARA